MMLRSCLLAYLLMLPSSALAAGDAPPSADGPPHAADVTATEKTDAAKPATADEPYKPPFPEREELFQPPSISRPVSQRQDTAEVALKGFIDVGGQQVLLAVNGRVKPLAVGQSAAGVEVIRIDPPKVTLQRGRVRWTETLFDIRSASVATASASHERASVAQSPATEANEPAAESPVAESPANEPSVSEPTPEASVPQPPVAQPKVVQPAVDQSTIEPKSDEAPVPPWIAPKL